MSFRNIVLGLAAFVTASATQATIVYDASPVDPTAVQITFAYAANFLFEQGGRVELKPGNARTAQSASIRLRTGSNQEPATPGNVDFTLTLYNGLGVDPFASTTINSAAPAGTVSVPRPFFNVNFDISSFGKLPDSFYWGLAINPFLNTTTNSINLSLWNYSFVFPNRAIDGPQVKAGTDLLGAAIWFRQRDINNMTPEVLGLAADTRFTPNFTLTAVPEPASWAMLIMGFGLVGAVARRRRSALA